MFLNRFAVLDFVTAITSLPVDRFSRRRCDRRGRTIELSEHDTDRDSSFLFFFTIQCINVMDRIGLTMKPHIARPLWLARLIKDMLRFIWNYNREICRLMPMLFVYLSHMS